MDRQEDHEAPGGEDEEVLGENPPIGVMCSPQILGTTHVRISQRIGELFGEMPKNRLPQWDPESRDGEADTYPYRDPAGQTQMTQAEDEIPEEETGRVLKSTVQGYGGGR